MCCLLDPTSLCDILSVWSLICIGPMVQAKTEVLSLALEHVIEPGELRFSIELLADWQSPIGRLCSD
jgi:hypothetical protein